MGKHKHAGADGLPLDALFRMNAGRSLTFDDLIILPRYVEEPPAEVDLRTGIGPKLTLGPIVSSPMDRVTEWRTAVRMALNGCVGVLHINLSPDDAARQARKVKRFQMGFIYEPLCGRPTDTVADARAVKQDHGFSTVLVTEDGHPTSRLLGIVTRTCIDFETDASRPLKEVMIPREKLAVREAREVPTLEHVRKVFRSDPSLAKLPVLNADGSVHALVIRRDVSQGEYPDAAVDCNRQLRVAAAVTTHPEDDERVKMLLDAGCDLFVIDSSQGGTGFAVQRIKQIRSLAPDVPIVAGNIVSPLQGRPLVEAGANALRIGMGPGSICITQEQYGLGRGQCRAIHDASAVSVPTVADGGIRHIGDMVKSLACGASFVMVGRYIAGCDETPSPIIEDNGRKYKLYRGMGSLGAMQARGALRYKEGKGKAPIVAQGVDDQRVPAIGPLDRRLAEALAGIRGALRQLGCGSIGQLHRDVREGAIRFELRTESARIEGGVHDLEPLPVRR